MLSFDQSADELSIYWRESTFPLSSMVLVAPLLMSYELSLLCQPEVARATVETWLQHGLTEILWGRNWLLPVAVCGYLLVAHCLLRHPWRIRWSLIPAMLCESLLGGIILVLILRASLDATALVSESGVADSLRESTRLLRVGPLTASVGFDSAVVFLATGIYEELFFRALMLSPIAWILKRLGETERMSVVTAVVVSSLLFALAHFHALGTAGEQFTWFAFTFRAMAGSLFAVLYLLRGFGIAAGTHITYDILVSLMYDGS